jgi:soluble lytic murein transglycosylase-like protein
MPSWLATAGMLAAVAILVGVLAAALTGLSDRSHAPAAVPAEARAQLAALSQELDLARSRLATAEGRLERMNQIAKYSSLYGLPADLAGAIYDIAREEGIHPSLGFQLVKVESGFRPVKSNRGAIGYTQLRLTTARSYDPKVTAADLYDRSTNLRFGFRFLHELLGRFDQDLQMALVAYNRGPSRVVDLLSKGEDPANGYAEAVLRKRVGAVNRGS